MSELQAQGLTLEPLPNAVYCVPSIKRRWQMTVPPSIGDAKLLAPPKRGPAPQVDAPFEHKAGIEQAPQGLRPVPVRAGNVLQEKAIDLDSPGNSPVPAESTSPWVPSNPNLSPLPRMGGVVAQACPKDSARLGTCGSPPPPPHREIAAPLERRLGLQFLPPASNLKLPYRDPRVHSSAA